MSMDGATQNVFSESFQTLIRYLNPKTPAAQMVAEDTLFDLAPLTESEAKILEMFLKSTNRSSIKLSSKADLSVDHILMILKMIGENPAFTKIDINFPRYAVNDLAILKDFITWPIERQRPLQVSSAERDVDDLKTAFSELLISARTDLAEVRTAASNSLRTALTSGRTFLTSYVAPAFNMLFEEDNPPMAVQGPEMGDAAVGPSTLDQRSNSPRQ